MKTAVVFYTFDGNCALVAEQINAQLSADFIRLKTEDEKKRRGFAKFFWGGGMVFLHKKPPLKPYTFDPSAYDLIIIGAPVWAGSPAPPIQTFLSQTVISGKKIALFVCHGGGKGKSLEKLKALLPGNEIAAEADFIEPARGDREELKRKVAEWVGRLAGNG
jgi:flavodoxin